MSAFLLYAGYRGGVISLGQSTIVIALLIVPLALWNLRQTRSGSYTNFDVSVRTERRSMYWVLLGLLSSVFLVLNILSKAFRLRVGLGSVLVMLACAAIINRYVKI